MKHFLGIVCLMGSFAFISFLSSQEPQAKLIEKSDEVVGIQFLKISYEEALKLSKKTGKPIFIDCYTVWCGPCKVLSKRTFTNPELGKFFNENFINMKVEMEKDADGPELARLFRVRAYPTLLFLNSDGTLIKQSLGYVKPDYLLNFAKEIVRK